MESTLLEVAKSIPVAGALIYLVVLFLKSLDKRDETLSKIQQDWNKNLAETVSSSNDCIDRNTNALIDMKGIIDKCKRTQ